MRAEAEGWWGLALEDLETARANLAAHRFYAAAFFSHQAVEKGLKAVWIEKRRELAPKSHNLPDLAAGVRLPQTFETAILRLNPLYVSTRYPDAANGIPARNFNEELASQILAEAEEIVAWCRSELGLS